MTRIPAVLNRGGTSKRPLILATDLPQDRRTLEAVLRAAMDSPHPLQIDGIGGAELLTSKVAIVSKSSQPGADVDYLFAQLFPNSSEVDHFAMCGSMSSAAGRFALERGLVPPRPSTTELRNFNLNTSSLIKVQVQTPEGEVSYDGANAIDGVDETAAPIAACFSATAGGKVGRLLPTGKSVDRISGIDVTCLDATNPAIIVAAQSIGITGYETKAELERKDTTIALLQELRVAAGRLMGLGDCSRFVLPKPIVVSAPRRGGTVNGREFVPDRCHAAFSVTGSIALSAACVIPGSVAQQITGLPSTSPARISIEYPDGLIHVEGAVDTKGATMTLEMANTIRTCGRLFDGNILVPSKDWDGSMKARSAASLLAEPERVGA